MYHHLVTTVLLMLSWSHLSNSLAVMSVDLGTEFVKIAIVKPGIPMEIALNKESRRKTHVIVAIKGKDREFGDAAVSRSMKSPQTSYMYLTELVGKTIDNPVIEQFLKRFPYYQLKTDPYSKQLIFQHDKSTNYTVEELLSMILKKAKEYASDFAEQPVDSAVITVPAYFTQSERRSIKRACDLAQIKLLQLMNDNTAVALNYGVFRRKDFNQTGSTYMFYDMGSQSTTATIVTYQIVKSKENGFLEDIPQLTVKGVGFDRNLGGLEFQIRIRDFLVKKFHEQHKNKYNLMENPRALTKLFREAERAKHVLSANMEYTAQVEGLVNDIDFKHKISRDQFETICSDLFKRVKLPIEEVLKTSGITLDEIQQVILFGGSTRIPKVQDELSKAVKQKELGKSINTDEAAAMGAVYQAAALSKGYRVKKFTIKDLNQYPINVQFERHLSNDVTELSSKLVDRTLFNRNNLYPQRKVMTFNRHIDDFDFKVHYGDLPFLSQQDKKILDHTDLYKVNVKGARHIYQKHKDTAESKGVKAHFRLDENCLIVLDRVEFVFGKKGVETTSDEKTGDGDQEKSTLSKLGNKISSFFGGKRSTSEEENESEPKPTENENTASGSSAEEINESSTTDNTATTTLPTSSTKTQDNEHDKEAEKDKEVCSATNTTATNGDKASGTESPNAKNNTIHLPKSININEPLEFTIEQLDFVDPTQAMIDSSIKKLRELDANDRLMHELATAKNNLEAFIYDMKDKVENDQRYIKLSTKEDLETIQTKLQEISEWLWEGDGITADVKSKLDELKSLTRALTIRVKEQELRPVKLKELKETLNLTEHFLKSAKMMIGEDQPFTDVEVKSLEKVIKDTQTWRDSLLFEQERTKPTDTPKYLSSDIENKIVNLKREVSYLLNKAQRFVPKPKSTPKPPTSSTSKKTTDANKTDDSDKKSTDTKQSTDGMDELKKEADNIEKLFEQQRAETMKDNDDIVKQSKRPKNDKEDIEAVTTDDLKRERESLWSSLREIDTRLKNNYVPPHFRITTSASSNNRTFSTNGTNTPQSYTTKRFRLATNADSSSTLLLDHSVIPDEGENNSNFDHQNNKQSPTSAKYLHSSIVPTNKIIKTKDDLISLVNRDSESTRRNRRMFGVLLGTLNKFKQENQLYNEQQQGIKRHEIEKRLELKQLEEKEVAQKERQDLLIKKRSYQQKLRELDTKLNLIERIAVYEKSQENLKYFIPTKTEPQLFYLPKRTDLDVIQQKLSEQKQTIEQKILDYKTSIQKELDDLAMYVLHLILEKPVDEQDQQFTTTRKRSISETDDVVDESLDDTFLEAELTLPTVKSQIVLTGNDEEEEESVTVPDIESEMNAQQPRRIVTTEDEQGEENTANGEIEHDPKLTSRTVIYDEEEDDTSISTQDNSLNNTTITTTTTIATMETSSEEMI
ncbi:unnamed protein product [Didymodactylos carnosus]|uniref:Hypoxia up-regulated protein 1 n=1 Tax=Didymodactylos carnosus TaxID=1234261 RepID=A0A813V8Q2_9BILA|nr:unnamed protein product [Didymodactylos carnosus]CAF3626401.1 unnamed protein product [Didymodactylos carnosus]